MRTYGAAHKPLGKIPHNESLYEPHHGEALGLPNVFALKCYENTGLFQAKHKFLSSLLFMSLPVAPSLEWLYALLGTIFHKKKYWQPICV